VSVLGFAQPLGSRYVALRCSPYLTAMLDTGRAVRLLDDFGVAVARAVELIGAGGNATRGVRR